MCNFNVFYSTSSFPIEWSPDRFRGEYTEEQPSAVQYHHFILPSFGQESLPGILSILLTDVKFWVYVEIRDLPTDIYMINRGLTYDVCP